MATNNGMARRSRLWTALLVGAAFAAGCAPPDDGAGDRPSPVAAEDGGGAADTAEMGRLDTTVEARNPDTGAGDTEVASDTGDSGGHDAPPDAPAPDASTDSGTGGGDRADAAGAADNGGAADGGSDAGDGNDVGGPCPDGHHACAAGCCEIDIETLPIDARLYPSDTSPALVVPSLAVGDGDDAVVAWVRDADGLVGSGSTRRAELARMATGWPVEATAEHAQIQSPPEVLLDDDGALWAFYGIHEANGGLPATRHVHGWSEGVLRMQEDSGHSAYALPTGEGTEPWSGPWACYTVTDHPYHEVALARRLMNDVERRSVVWVEGTGPRCSMAYDPMERPVVGFLDSEPAPLFAEPLAGGASIGQDYDAVVTAAGVLHVAFVAEDGLWLAILADGVWSYSRIEAYARGALMRGARVVDLEVDAHDGLHAVYLQSEAAQLRYARWGP